MTSQPSDDHFLVRLRDGPGHGPVDVILAISTTSQVAECQSCSGSSSGRGIVLASIPLEFSRVVVDAEHEAGSASVVIDAGESGGRWCFEQISENAESEQRFFSLPGKLASAGALRTDFEREFRVLGNIRPAAGSKRSAEVVFVRPKHGRRCAFAVKITSPNDESLIREIRALRKLNHPNIVQFFEAYELSNPTRWGMVINALDGGNLFHRVKGNGGPMGDFQALVFVEQIFQGLSYIHNNGMVHRDVKPDNVVLEARNENHLRLIDFGLAANEGGPEMQRRCGTPGYVAPEVLLGRPYGRNVDCFSTGIVLYFLLKGIDPFAGPPVAKVLKRNVRCDVNFDHAAFLGCRSLLSQCIQADPSSRCQSGWAVEESQRLMAACARPVAPPALVNITPSQDQSSIKIANPAYDFCVVKGKKHFKPLDPEPGEQNQGTSAGVNTPSSQQQKSQKPDKFGQWQQDQREFGPAAEQIKRVTSNISNVSKCSQEDLESWESWHVSSVATSSNSSSSQSKNSGSLSKSSGLFSDPRHSDPRLGSQGGGNAGGYPGDRPSSLPLSSSSTGQSLQAAQKGRKVSDTASRRKSSAFESFLESNDIRNTPDEK